MAFSLLDVIRQNADRHPAAPALITPRGAIAYAELADSVVNIANHFDDRRLPRLGKALINVGSPEIQLIAVLAALEYGLVPLLAQVETIEADFAYDFCIAGSVPARRDV